MLLDVHPAPCTHRPNTPHVVVWPLAVVVRKLGMVQAGGEMDAKRRRTMPEGDERQFGRLPRIRRNNKGRNTYPQRQRRARGTQVRDPSLAGYVAMLERGWLL